MTFQGHGIRLACQGRATELEQPVIRNYIHFNLTGNPNPATSGDVGKGEKAKWRLLNYHDSTCLIPIFGFPGR
jgi:hypothetical protein